MTLDVCSRSFKVKTENHEQVYQVHTDSVYTFLTLNLIIFSLNHPLRLTLCSSILHIVCKLMTLSETYQNKRQARMYLYDFKINFSVSVSDERPRRCSQDQGWIIVRYILSMLTVSHCSLEHAICWLALFSNRNG